jgi:hypothetical protein
LSEFIFMLTHDDVTVPDALSVWRSVENTGLRYAGFKDIGIDLEDRKRLVDAIHVSGRPVMLEVVSVSREDELRAVESAIPLGFDYLLGGTRAAEVAPMLKGTPIRYLPFPGRVVGHPSVLEGTSAEITSDARRLVAMEGVAGLDLLAYRHAADPEGVAASVIAGVHAPVVIAGSIASVERVRRVCELGAWGFTVGSALFEGGFGPPGASMGERIEAVLRAADGGGRPAG